VTTQGGLTLEMSRVLPAPPSAVFTALTDPGELAKWWGPKGFTCPSVDFDPRVGGGFRIRMQPPESAAFDLTGEFLEVDPPVRVAYTFRWDPPDPDDRETTVALTLSDLGSSTELALVQGTFATDARRALHDAGWTDAFERLAELLSAGQQAER
jgi:uncharacterized protein YndB with AHSA1/START domain